jgi:hypothetical protein
MRTTHRVSFIEEKEISTVFLGKCEDGTFALPETIGSAQALHRLRLCRGILAIQPAVMAAAVSCAPARPWPSVTTSR